MLEWREIETSSDPVLRRFLATYEASFPIEVRVPSQLIVALIDRKVRGDLALGVLHVGVAFDADLMVGGAVFDFLHQCNIGFIDYIFVDPQMRGRGIGQFIYERLFNTLEGDASGFGLERMQGILFEIEKEDLTAQAEERRQRVRRLRFFLRMGAGIISGLDYLQPPLHPGEEPLPMHLMLHPIGIPEEQLSGSMVLSWIGNVYAAIYSHECGVNEAIVADCLRRVAASARTGHIVLRRPGDNE